MIKNKALYELPKERIFEEFKKSNIDVELQKFQHPIYKQIHGEFIPEMSIIDLLFNEGRDGTKEILQNSVLSSS